jgi:hypothetical protein
MQERLVRAIGDLQSNDTARINAGLAALETIRAYKGPRKDVADLLLALRNSSLQLDDQRLVEELSHWATMEHLPLLRELKKSGNYERTSLRGNIDRLAWDAEEKKFDDEWEAEKQEHEALRERQQQQFAARLEEQRQRHGPSGASWDESPLGADEDDDFFTDPISPAQLAPETATRQISPEEQRAKWLADLKSGDFFTMKAAAEKLQNAAQPVADEELTGALVQLLGNSSPFLRQAAVGALKKWGTEHCLEALRDTLRSGQGSVFEKRDTLAAIRDIEKRLGLADEPGEPVTASKRLRAGDKVFVQTNDGLVPGKVVQPLPRGFYRVMIGEEGFGETGDVSPNQLRLPKKPAASALTLTSTSAAAIPAGPPAGEYRLWTDATGNFSVSAQFVALENGQVQLCKQVDGQTISLPVEKLSAADQQYLQQVAQ